MKTPKAPAGNRCALRKMPFEATCQDDGAAGAPRMFLPAGKSGCMPSLFAIGYCRGRGWKRKTPPRESILSGEHSLSPLSYPRCRGRRGVHSGLFPEISVVESFEPFSVTSLVPGHFMDSVVDGIQILLFGECGDAFLSSHAPASASMRFSGWFSYPKPRRRAVRRIWRRVRLLPMHNA